MSKKITKSEIKSFIELWGTKVYKNEPSHFVDLMMDNHKCIQDPYGKNQYYIGKDLVLTEREQEIWEELVYNHHV